jgi:hypothetical protein
MRPYQPRRVAAVILALLFTLYLSAAQEEARAQAGAGKRTRAGRPAQGAHATASGRREGARAPGRGAAARRRR